jgi:hypothetical protein
MKEEPMQDYYYQPTNFWRKLRCAFRLIPLFVGLGHDFEIQYTVVRRWAPFMDDPVGEAAYVCRLCFRVEQRRNYKVLPEISYGSSPSMGRRLERRQVDYLPIAPDGQEPTCGAGMPYGMYEATGSATLVTCRKFLWHRWSPDRSMRTHSGSRPAPGGYQTFMWDDKEDAS